jgi:hypothetical protein
MSRTFKDKKSIHNEFFKTHSDSQEKTRSRRFEQFKKFGPPEPRNYSCPYCGNHTEFERGYLVCHECGGVEMAFMDLILDPVAA